MSIRMRLLRRIHLFGVAALPVVLATVLTAAQPASLPSFPSAQEPGGEANRPEKKNNHASDFLIRGTVFNDKALSFPGVELRIRKAGEKKYQWETYTNSRGEFAVRVPQGGDYEMLAHAKGFSDQMHTVDAKNGENQENVVFRMQQIAGGKK